MNSVRKLEMKGSAQDIDECAAKMHYCHANTVCVNLPGSYRCDCVAGYVRVDDFSCTEHDECGSGQHNCDENAICTNTVRGHSCTCKPGYVGNGTICRGAVPCSSSGIDTNQKTPLSLLFLLISPITTHQVTSAVVCNNNLWATGSLEVVQVLWETADPGNYLYTVSFFYFQVSSQQIQTQSSLSNPINLVSTAFGSITTLHNALFASAHLKNNRMDFQCIEEPGVRPKALISPKGKSQRLAKWKQEFHVG
ncbi:hypothetical protein BTVI_44008 [Pitangus sulphuratus]|nr:hypothetical protein BTVI_44008 [Pitangus sulphuratus]